MELIASMPVVTAVRIDFSRPCHEGTHSAGPLSVTPSKSSLPWSDSIQQAFGFTGIEKKLRPRSLVPQPQEKPNFPDDMKYYPADDCLRWDREYANAYFKAKADAYFASKGMEKENSHYDRNPDAQPKWFEGLEDKAFVSMVLLTVFGIFVFLGLYHTYRWISRATKPCDQECVVATERAPARHIQIKEDLGFGVRRKKPENRKQ